MLNQLYLPVGRYRCVLSRWLFASLLLMMVSCACTDTRKPEAEKREDPQVGSPGVSASQQTAIKQAIATVHPLKGGDDIKGQVVFTKVPGGIQVVADVEGLSPGEHGFHVHEFGSCEGDGASAGAHFNPTNQPHGGPDDVKRHVGDLGNLAADDNGKAHYERVDQVISFEGTDSILGRSIIIHADRDDYVTQPTGNSGARIACGVIEAVGT